MIQHTDGDLRLVTLIAVGATLTWLNARPLTGL